MKKTLTLLVLVIITFSTLSYLVYLKHINSVYDVIPGKVFRSAQLDKDAIESTVNGKGIRSIINLRGENPGNEWYRDEIEISESLGVLHHDLRFSSMGLPPRNSVKKLINLLQTAERPVLVHCKAGADRAGLASIIALLLHDTSGLDEIAKHVSMRYLALRPESTGKLFYKQYSDWLMMSKTRHTTKQFLKWLETEYVDDKGNLSYYIDKISGIAWKNGKKYTDGFSFIVDRKKTDMLTINGWLFDRKLGNLVKRIEILMNSKPVGNVQYGQSRPDVAKVFNSSVLNTGWNFRKSLRGFRNGCYDLALGVERLDGSRWVTPPEARICLQ